MRTLQEKFIKQYAYLLIVIYFTYLFFLIRNLKSFEWRLEIFYLLFSISLSVLTVIFEKKIFDFITFRFLINSQVIYVSCELFIFSFIFYPNFPTLIVYLTVIPVNLYLVNDIKKTLGISLLLTVFSLSVIYFGPWNIDIGVKQNININNRLGELFIDYFPFYTSLISIIFVSYYHVKFSDFRKNESTLLLADLRKTINRVDKKDTVLNDVYLRCELLMQEKKVYLDPDYTIMQLAEDINSNQNYVSNALGKIGNTNFRDFINHYRLERIMNEINEDKHKSFKLHYLFSKSGFRHASSFNRAFKKKYGVSPSEMIKNMK